MLRAFMASGNLLLDQRATLSSLDYRALRTEATVAAARNEFKGTWDSREHPPILDDGMLGSRLTAIQSTRTLPERTSGMAFR
jgi:hypothetical protein